jgi:hypothetical protein
MRKAPQLRRIIERDKSLKVISPHSGETAKRQMAANEHLERLAVIALKRVCVQLGVKYWQ